MMSPIGMLAPLIDIVRVMGAEVVTIFGAEMVLRPAFIMVAIVPAPFLIFRSAAILSGSVLRDRYACESQNGGSKHYSI